MNVIIIADINGKILAFQDVSNARVRSLQIAAKPGDLRHEIPVPVELEDYFMHNRQKLSTDIRIEVVGGQSHLRKIV